jgi:hypothetical protein
MNRNVLVFGSLFVGSVLAVARSLSAKAATAIPVTNSTPKNPAQVTI